MLKFISSKLAIEDLAIDLTGNQAVIIQRGKGVIVTKPPLVVVDEDDTCLHVGTDAEAIRGKTPRGVRVISPIQNGIIAEPEYCEKMLQHFLKGIYSRKNIFRFYPSIFAAIPHHASTAERKNYEETLDAVGSKDVSLVDSILAASYGVGLSAETCSASVVCNISNDYTEVGLISMNKVHYASRVNIGYKDIIKAVSLYVKNDTEYSIGERAAEQAVKHLAAAAYLPEVDDSEFVTIPGTIKRTSTPVEVTLRKIEVHNAITPCVESFLVAIIEVLEQAKDDMASDLISNGITILGIGATLSRIDEAIELHTGVKTRTSKSPQTCIAEGVEKIMMRMKGIGYT